MLPLGVILIWKVYGLVRKRIGRISLQRETILHLTVVFLAPIHLHHLYPVHPTPTDRILPLTQAAPAQMSQLENPSISRSRHDGGSHSNETEYHEDRQFLYSCTIH